MQGKVVLVTGANGGLGRYVAQSFLDAGATVVGNSRKIQQSDFSGANFVALPGGVRYLRPGDPGSCTQGPLHTVLLCHESSSRAAPY